MTGVQVLARDPHPHPLTLTPGVLSVESLKVWAMPTHTLPHLFLEFVEFLLQSLLLLAQSGGYHQHGGSWFGGRAQDIVLHCHRPEFTRRPLLPIPPLQACLLPIFCLSYPLLNQAAVSPPRRDQPAFPSVFRNHGYQRLGAPCGQEAINTRSVAKTMAPDPLSRWSW